MKTTQQALLEGFTYVVNDKYWYFSFGEDDEYQLTFEPLHSNVMYVALYKNGVLLTNKVVVKAGYVRKVKPTGT